MFTCPSCPRQRESEMDTPYHASDTRWNRLICLFCRFSPSLLYSSDDICVDGRYYHINNDTCSHV